MKKEVVLFGILALIFIMPFATSISTNVTTNAKSCLLNAVSQQGCDTFGLQDKIFTLLSAKRCKTELLASASNNECFGESGCTVKDTSRAVLALSESGSDTTNFINWILAQNKTVPNLEWLLQVDSNGVSHCTINDENQGTYSLTIAENKKLTLSASQNCLAVDSSGYWLRINPSCYDQEFSISCDSAFLTSLLFRKTNSDILYVSTEAQTKSAGGTTFEKINQGSSCLKKGNNCDYEGTAWAALTFKKIGEDYSDFLPYLIVFKPDNEGLLPEAFLYYLTGDENYKIELISKQIGNRYWDAFGNKYTDTALALLPFSSEDFEAKTNAVDWLATVQGSDGCWDSKNIAETGFILYSLTGSSDSGEGGEDTNTDCLSQGYSCVHDTDCSSENILSGYDCSGFSDVCCSEDTSSQQCEANVCDSYYNEVCPDGYANDNVTMDEGQTCCLVDCESSTPSPSTYDDTCTPAGGTCADTSCEKGTEPVDYYTCSDITQTCCIKKKKGTSPLLIILSILIILAVIAIIFKDKLKDLYFKFKTKGNQQSQKRTPSRPLQRTNIPPRRTLPARSIPSRVPQQRRALIKKPAPSKKNELDDVLKKLKDMSK